MTLSVEAGRRWSSKWLHVWCPHRHIKRRRVGH